MLRVEAMSANNAVLKTVEEEESVTIVARVAEVVVNNRRIAIGVSLWTLGLSLSVFANGFHVDEATRELYEVAVRKSQEIERFELVVAQMDASRAFDEYYNQKGWFSCDSKCTRDYEKYTTAQAQVEWVENKADRILGEARAKVGIWSVFGIADVRAGFWHAWKWGKDTAARMTTYDAVVTAMNTRRKEGNPLVNLAFKHIANLIICLFMSVIYFVRIVCNLLGSYDEPLHSLIAFFLLAVVTACSVVCAYLALIIGTVFGGVVLLLKLGDKQHAVEGNAARSGALQDMRLKSSQVLLR